MLVNIKTEEWVKLDYETKGACAFDFKAIQDYIIQPTEVCMVDTWTVIQVPEWYMLQCAARSSTFKKLWLLLVNSIGIIDNDYCGNNDTIKFQYLNMFDKAIEIKKWDRIWQWVFVKIEKAEFQYVDDMWTKDRWGFWTTWI